MKINKSRLILMIGALILIAGCIVWEIQKGSSGYTEEPAFSDPYEAQLFAMDTVMNFTAYGENGQKAVDTAIDEVQRLEGLLSTEIESSEIYQLNKNGTFLVSDETAELIQRALEIYKETNGALDISIYPLMMLWGFPTGEYYVPSQEEIDEILPLVDASKITVTEEEDGMRVSLGEGQQIDLGAIAKGYTSSRIIDIFKENGVTSGMISLGGNVQVLGRKPDGEPWRIGIRDAFGDSSNDIAETVEAEDEALVTSGGYERYFEQNGKTYIHIIDPKTGWPVENDLASVTIISSDGTLADGLSTALFVMGRDQAQIYQEKHKDQFDMILQ